MCVSGNTSKVCILRKTCLAYQQNFITYTLLSIAGAIKTSTKGQKVVIIHRRFWLPKFVVSYRSVQCHWFDLDLVVFEDGIRSHIPADHFLQARRGRRVCFRRFLILRWAMEYFLDWILFLNITITFFKCVQKKSHFSYENPHNLWLIFYIESVLFTSCSKHCSEI